MNILKFRISLLFFLAAITVSANGHGNSMLIKEYAKTIVKEFKLSQDGEVVLNNQHGIVEVEVWDQSSVKIKVEIIVDANSEQRAQEIFDKIQISFDNKDKMVRCSTAIEKDSYSFWSWLTSGSNSDNDYAVNYQVFMPRQANLSLANKYGDCTVNALEGNASYDIRYGNLTSECSGGDVNLNISYGKAHLGDVGKMKADIKYSDLRCENIRELHINSKYSSVNIDECKNLVSSSKFDDYEIHTVGTFTNEGKYDDISIHEVDEIKVNTVYADVKIGILKSTADFVFKYGEVEIKETAHDFKSIAMEGNYADYDIGISQLENFNVVLEGNYTDFECKKDIHIIEEDNESQKIALKAYLGNRDGGGEIVARLSYGSLKLR